MIEDTKWVSKIEAQPGGKAGTFWKVTWHDGKTDRIFDPAMRDTCNEAMTNQLAVHYSKEKQGNYWNITALELVKDAMPPPTDPQMLPEHEQVVKDAVKSVREVAPVKSEIPGQQIGMTVKEIGDMIRSEKLKGLFGVDAAMEIIKWYRGQILGTTRVPFDGAKLPTFKQETQG